MKMQNPRQFTPARRIVDKDTDFNVSFSDCLTSQVRGRGVCAPSLIGVLHAAEHGMTQIEFQKEGESYTALHSPHI